MKRWLTGDSYFLIFLDVLPTTHTCKLLCADTAAIVTFVTLNRSFEAVAS